MDSMVRVDSKGRFLIPREDRINMGIRPGDKVILYTTENDEIVMKRVDMKRMEDGGCNV